VLVERGPGFRFLERSSTLTARTWQHERTVSPRGSSCELVDRVVVELRPAVARVARAAAVHQSVVEKIFTHRHRRLAAMYETTPTPATPT
ncbi:MAG TPA: hypothetical protein VGK05_00565, partial [Acidimicrobiia bacterium]